MKPDEEMHAAVEEVDLDPCDLYTDLGTLIVEGRLPGATERGFVEGPHCANPHGQNRHQCDQSSTECQKYEQILKHMLLLWKNSIPMTIEVLLYPNCCTPFQNVDSVPDLPYILIEQWTIHMLPRRVPDASITSRGLIQAVRSFLHFSQLCAWYSLTKGRVPQNIHYRVCVPGEAFSSKFSSQPDCHIFPISNVGRSSAMKVLVKSLPRCGEIPTVPCHKHSDPKVFQKCSKSNSENVATSNVEEYPCDGILPVGVSSRTNSPADTMLGESLLDPPNSLCMYPKRYQSPSRCGSPSIEVPEHLMFGKTNLKCEEQVPKRRSRPQRRPVVERFLKKNMGDCTVSDCNSRNFDKSYSTKDSPADFLLKRDAVLNYCIDDSIKHVPKEEMEHVLERLRDRHVHKKGLYKDSESATLTENGNNMNKKSLSRYVEEMNINPAMLDCNMNAKKNSFLKFSECDDLKYNYNQPLWLVKESNKICDSESKFISSSDKLPLSPEVQNNLQQHNGSSLNLKDNKPTNLLPNKVNYFQLSTYKSLKKNHNNLLRSMKQKSNFTPQSTSELRQPVDKPYQNVYWDSVKSSEIHPKYSAVNIKKCGAFLSKNVDELSDERELSRLIDKSSSIPDSSNDEENNQMYEIPSAEKKASFRRSLDSATSLVFHQRSGLPLTSSPAPMRKSGTSFDFDSSIISVSAIKRALFEKEPEERAEENENDIYLSSSAPASMFSSSLLGTFEESVLNGRLEPVSTVEGFTAEIGASGSFCPRHIKLPVTVFFYTLHDMDKVTSPYMGHINLNSKDYHVPKKGTVQVTLFNPHQTVVKMFVIRYDLSDMPINCQTFLRQRTLYMPSDSSENDVDAQKWLRYLIHLRFMSSKSGRIYLHTDIRMIIFRKSDLDAATVHGQRPYELRTFTHGPQNPKFSPHKP